MSSRNKVVDHGPRELYAAVPSALARDNRLKHSTRSAALYIWSHDSKWQQSRNDVAEALGMSVNTAGNALAELQRFGWMVREIRKGGETWHRNLTNTPFTAEQIQQWTGSKTDPVPTSVPDQKMIQSDGTGSNSDLPTGSKTDPVTGSNSDPHRSRCRSAPEVHDCSSAITDQDEIGLESRSLAVAGRPGTDSNPWGGSTSELATAGSTAALQARLYEDPFADYETHRAEASAREEREARAAAAARDRHVAFLAAAEDPFAT